MKNVVIISSSLRINSNSEILAKELAKGALMHHNVELINLKNYNIKYCKGCLACQKIGKCVIDDDMKNIIDKVKNADVLVFSSPIYFYSISGLLKTFIDRLNPLYESDYKFKEVYLITTCADTSKDAINVCKNEIEGFVSCFPKAKLIETFCGTGCELANDVLKYQDLLEKVRQTGENI